MELEKEIQQSKFESEYQRLIINILFTGGWINSLHTKRLKVFDISPQQFNILRILRGRNPEPATINLLQERMLDKMSNASRLVEKLRLKGLVERRACDKDRRAVDVIITAKGLALLGELDKTANKWEDNFTALTEEEARKLNQLLDKLRG